MRYLYISKLSIAKFISVSTLFMLAYSICIGALPLPGKQKIKTSDGEIKSVDSFKGRQRVIIFTGKTKNSNTSVTFKATSGINAGGLTSVSFDYLSYIADLSNKNFFEINIYLLPVKQNTGILPYRFRFRKPSKSWKKFSRKIFIPSTASGIRVVLRTTGKIKFYISEFKITSRLPQFSATKTSVKHLLFHEDFESFDEIHAHGGRIGWPFTALTDNKNLRIVKGKFGKALLIKNTSADNYIIYPAKDKISLLQGTIEFWLKTIFSESKNSNNKTNFVFFMKNLGKKTDRIQIFSGFAGRKCIGIRFSGGNPSWYSQFFPKPDKWHHFMFTWKSGSENKASFSVYIDGKKLKTVENISIEFINDLTSWHGKIPVFQIGGVYKPSGDTLIIDRFRIWDICLSTD